MNNELYHACCESKHPEVWTELVKNQGMDLNAHWSEYYGDAFCLAAWKGDNPMGKIVLQYKFLLLGILFTALDI